MGYSTGLDEVDEQRLLDELRSRWRNRREGLCDYCGQGYTATNWCKFPMRHVSGLPAMPEIVCLCGSTRFSEAWVKARYDLTLAGKIVLTIGCDTKSDDGLGITADQKAALDELHKRKIDLADRILVLNVGGYIGESTRSEIEYAVATEKPVDYLEPAERSGF